MTKKDYKNLSTGIATIADPHLRALACAVVGLVLQADSPRFDMLRFAAACGVTEGQAETAKKRALSPNT